MKRRQWHLMAAVLLFALALSGSRVTLGAEAGSTMVAPQAENLLVNSSMEEGFYWQYPNHFIANGWQRWWMNGSVIPEFDDARAWRPYAYDGTHAQNYFWVWNYTAGVSQRVSVQPCTFYEFGIFGRNHSWENTDHHARIGIDPQGRGIGPYVPSLSSDIVWSPEVTYYRTWGAYTVTAEALTDTITAITYAAPETGYAPYETFWDAGHLVVTEPPEGRLPAPPSLGSDGFITGVVSSTLFGSLTVEWHTAEPASTQVWYSSYFATQISTTLPYSTAALYLPVVLNDYSGIPSLEFSTYADQEPVTYHTARLGPLLDGQTVDFVVVSRYLADGECKTVTSDPIRTVVHIDPFYTVHIPLVLRTD